MKILLIEDNADLLLSYKRLLARSDHEIITHDSGVGVLDGMVDEINPDLVITDHNLGVGYTGLEIAKALIADKRKVILMSANYEAEEKAMIMGIPFILKGDPELLLTMVDQINNIIR